MMEVERIPFPQVWTEVSGQEDLIWCEEYNHQFQPAIPLMYEAAVLHGMETLKPWEKLEDTIPGVLNEWKNVKAELLEKFNKRDYQSAVEPMRKGGGLFIEMLYWVNHQPAAWPIDEPSSLLVKPVNFQERMNFIFSYLNKYHSFIQLTELFVEMEKLYNKQLVIKKAKPST